MKAIEQGAEFSPALQRALKEAEQREQTAIREVSDAEHDLSAMEIKEATRLDHKEAVHSLVKAMEDGEKGRMLDRLRYALGRSVDRIVLEDGEGVRTVRLEIGTQIRYIDFSKTELTYRLRGEEELFGGVLRTNKNGEKVYWIP